MQAKKPQEMARQECELPYPISYMPWKNGRQPCQPQQYQLLAGVQPFTPP
jgi:hypothetical protein